MKLTPGKVFLLWQPLTTLSASSLEEHIRKQQPKVSREIKEKLNDEDGENRGRNYFFLKREKPREARVILSLMMLTSWTMEKSWNNARSWSSVMCFGTCPTNSFTLSSFSSAICRLFLSLYWLLLLLSTAFFLNIYLLFSK